MTDIDFERDSDIHTLSCELLFEEVRRLAEELRSTKEERDRAIREYGFLMDSLPPDYFKTPPCECGGVR